MEHNTTYYLADPYYLDVCDGYKCISSTAKVKDLLRDNRWHLYEEAVIIKDCFYFQLIHIPADVALPENYRKPYATKIVALTSLSPYISKGWHISGKIFFKDNRIFREIYQL